MDLHTVSSLRAARTRSDLVLSPGEGFLAGGTWLFSEPQRELTGLVDLTTMGWKPFTLSEAGLSIAATCTVGELVAGTEGTGIAPLVRACAEALLMSAKIWAFATVGGNLCLGLPAGAMISLAAALDAEAVIWTAGGERRQSVSTFVTGPGATTLAAGEVLRSVEVASSVLAARTSFRRFALTALGRSSSVVIGRRDADALVLTITAATPAPVVLRFAAVPDDAEVLGALAAVATWYTDAHGAADWRAAVTRVLVREVLEELR